MIDEWWQQEIRKQERRWRLIFFATGFVIGTFAGYLLLGVRF